MRRACTDLMISKTFDNGMICASEQAVIVDQEIKDEFESFMKANNCYFLNPEEMEKVTKYVINLDKHGGQSCGGRTARREDCCSCWGASTGQDQDSSGAAAVSVKRVPVVSGEAVPCTRVLCFGE